MTARALLVLSVVATALTFWTPSASYAACGWTAITHRQDGKLMTEVKKVDCPSRSGGTEVGPVDIVDDSPDPVGISACIGAAISMQVDPKTYCTEPAEEDQPQVTPGLVARALRSTPLPPSRLIVQPPNGRTLVNFATNFYTERDELTRVLRLLGRRVELRITPARFTWHFDDGATVTTTTPGAPYPRLDVTHEYRTEGGVSPRVDTTYTAVFRVGNGGWRPVPGSVTIPGEAVALDVVEGEPGPGRLRVRTLPAVSTDPRRGT